MIDWVVDRPELRLGCGDSAGFDGAADLVLSHLYGPLPPQLVGRPAVVNVVAGKEDAAARWAGRPLRRIGQWGQRLPNIVLTANLPEVGVDLSDLAEEEFRPGRGWFPLELPLRLLGAIRHLVPGGIVFDGFMGRGTVGKAALQLGYRFVGVDLDPARVALAREYVGC